ncbi:hypothetical protein [Alkalihalobacillus pseudalcaliphilus]|nr:hypothetical protein [Alkalihalobacillus pseudalcaliphilus]
MTELLKLPIETCCSNAFIANKSNISEFPTVLIRGMNRFENQLGA